MAMESNDWYDLMMAGAFEFDFETEEGNGDVYNDFNNNGIVNENWLDLDIFNPDHLEFRQEIEPADGGHGSTGHVTAATSVNNLGTDQLEFGLHPEMDGGSASIGNEAPVMVYHQDPIPFLPNDVLKGLQRSEEPPEPEPLDLVGATGFQQQHMSSTVINETILPFGPSICADSVPAPPCSPRVIDKGSLQLLFMKKLQKSDVSAKKRIILPKYGAENHLPDVIPDGGITLAMVDMDGRHIWCFKYTFWRNNKTRMYVLENTGEFAREHELCEGDSIGIYRHSVNKNYVIEAIKDVNDQQDENVDHEAEGFKNAADPPTNDVINPQFADVGADMDVNTSANSSVDLVIEVDSMGTPPINDTSVTNDHMFYFLREAILTKYSRPPQPSVGTFESINHL